MQNIDIYDTMISNTKGKTNMVKAGAQMSSYNNITNYFEKADVTLTPKEQDMVKRITEVYAVFGIKIGPLIGIVSREKTTRFDFAINSDAVFPKIRKLRDDVSFVLSVPPAKLTCPIEGKLAFGIELPNNK